MKPQRTFVLFLIFLTCFCSACIAKTPDELIQERKAERLEAYSQMQESANSGEFLFKIEVTAPPDKHYTEMTEQDFDCTVAYKVYNAKSENIIKLYEKTKTFRSVIDTDAWYWILPNGENGWEQDFVYNDELQRLKGGGSSSPIKYEVGSGEEVSIDFSDEAVLYRFFKELNTQNITDLELIHCWDYARTMFMYAVADGVEYVIPYTGRQDFSPLQNGKLYTVAEALEILHREKPEVEEMYDNPQKYANTDGGVGGTVVTEPESSDALNAEDVPVSENVEFGRNDADVPTATDGDQKPDNMVFYIILGSISLIVVAGATILALKRK